MFSFRSLSAVAVVTVAATLASGAAAQEEASVTEYITLPKFCWYQYGGSAVAGMNLGQEGQMLNCGPRVNHYCYGLLDLQRAKKAKNIADRRTFLLRARTHTMYTLDGLKLEGTMATCSITPHVQATMRDIDLQMKIYNVKSK
ncbi:MAG: hypothetical protein ABW318_14105 [Vicinamibacterales bacterium]